MSALLCPVLLPNATMTRLFTHSSFSVLSVVIYTDYRCVAIDSTLLVASRVARSLERMEEVGPDMANARQLRLARLLREFREKAGVDQQQVAKYLGIHRSAIGHWEVARSRPSKEKLEQLLDAYGVDDEERLHVEQMRADSNKSGWWTLHKLPSTFEPYVGFEADAVEAFNFESGLVPGLLQTREYSRAVHRSARRPLSPLVVENHVDARARRQERLDEDDPLVLHVVIAEEAFLRVMGSERIMAEQVDHLIAMSKRDNIRVHLLPLNATGHTTLQCGFSILRFPQHGDVAFVDTPLSGHIADAPEQTGELNRLFAQYQNAALAVPESRSYLATLRARYVTDA